MGKARLEAFSDGVVAILITILVLELKVPHGTDWAALRPLLPVFLTYLLSFVYLGIYWVNHHHLLHTLERVTGGVLWANLHLLLWLSLVPFTTGWMGENHGATPSPASTATRSPGGARRSASARPGGCRSRSTSAGSPSRRAPSRAATTSGRSPAAPARRRARSSRWRRASSRRSASSPWSGSSAVTSCGIRCAGWSPRWSRSAGARPRRTMSRTGSTAGPRLRPGRRRRPGCSSRRCATPGRRPSCRLSSRSGRRCPRAAVLALPRGCADGAGPAPLLRRRLRARAAWSGPRRLDQFPDLIRQFHQILERFLNQLFGLDQAFVADDTLVTLSQRGQVGSTPTAGLDLNQPRLRAVLQAVLALAVTPGGFSVSHLAQKVRELLGWHESQYQPRHASYDLKTLRGKNWIHKIDHSRRYEPEASGLKAMAALLTLRDKVIKPILASVTQPKNEPKPSPRTDLDLQYGKVQTEMRTLLLMLGMAV